MLKNQLLTYLVFPVVFTALLSSSCGEDVAGSETDMGAPTTDLGDAAQDVETDTTTPPGVVRFIHISDIHVHGSPGDVNGTSFDRALGRLTDADIEADVLIATGDYVDYLEDGLAEDVATPLHYAVDGLSSAPWPAYMVVGNHEYYQNEQLVPTTDRYARDSYLAGVVGRDLDYTFTANGIRFIGLNSMAGDLWLDNAGLVGSFTDDQMTLVREEVADGRPTILFFHHPPVPGITAPAGDSLCEIIGDYPGTVKGVFSGHLHGFWQGDFCGVPYFLVRDFSTATSHLLVEYDAPADALTVLNSEDFSFGEQPEIECNPEAAGLSDPGAAVTTNQLIHVGGVVSNLPGLEGFDGDAMDKVPLVLRVNSWDPTEQQFHAELTVGQKNDGWVEYTAGSPCSDIVLNVDGPCVVSDSVALWLDALTLVESWTGVVVDVPGQVRISIESLWFEAELVEEDGVPHIDEGVVHMNGSGTQALEDLQLILINEYCAGNIDGCEPGSSDSFPACPAEPDLSFFDSVPPACDVDVGQYELRFFLMFLSSYPLDNITLVGEFSTEVRPVSDESEDGSIDSRLFANEEGMNCAD